MVGGVLDLDFLFLVGFSLVLGLLAFPFFLGFAPGGVLSASASPTGVVALKVGRASSSLGGSVGGGGGSLKMIGAPSALRVDPGEGLTISTFPPSCVSLQTAVATFRGGAGDVSFLVAIMG